MNKLNNKLDNFSKALRRLNEANTSYKSNPDNDICQDAMIKRFEFTLELAWKALREYMIDEGYSIAISSPKGIMSIAFQEGLVDNENVWLGMLDDRNLTAHDYGRELASVVAERISNQYCKELARLSRLLSDKTD